MIQLNQQQPAPPAYRGDGALEVHSVFYTIQGEGPFAGTPAVFVRLTGCNLQCPDCDTEYTSKREMMAPPRLVSEVNGVLVGRACRPKPLVVFTGGEPFRQNIWPAVRDLVASGFINIQVETNGTLGWPEDEIPCVTATVVCSPKKSFVCEQVQRICRHLKYVVEAGRVHHADGLPTATMGYGGQVARPWPGFTGTVWLQPLDAKDEAQNAANRKAVVDSCQRHGYRVSLQTHKYLGVE